MSEQLTSWERPRFEPGGGNAFLLFALYGTFADDADAATICRQEYRTEGWPRGMQTRRWKRGEAEDGGLPFLQGQMGQVARNDNPEAFAVIEQAPECLVVQGEIADSPTLDYLRDTIGMIAWWLDHGALAALDPQRLKLYDPVAWGLDLFAPLPPRLLNHVVVLGSSQGTRASWLRTRGLRKFGRPDLSMRQVPADGLDAVLELFNRLILFQQQGGIVQESQSIRLAGLPDGLTCHHAGRLDDPDFNNVHLEIRWPGTYSF